MTGIEPPSEQGRCDTPRLRHYEPQVAFCNPPTRDGLTDKQTQESGWIENFDHFHDRQFTLQLTTA
jgi:hypothetical protein